MYEHDPAPDDHAPDDVVLRAVPDLAGLPVEDASGLTVGELFGALTEAETGLVRYIDLSLERRARHVLVPIGHARVREGQPEGPRIRLRAALLEELEQIPPFPADVGHIDDPFERALLEAYGRSFHGERYYAHPSYDHDGLYAGEHPVVLDEATHDAGTAEAPTAAAAPASPASGEEPAEAAARRGHLRRLAYLPGWRVAKGEPDIRGWPLGLDDGDPMRITDLVVEPAEEKVRYVVATDDDGRTPRLLPVGFLRIDDENGVVRAPGIARADFLALPEYDGGGLTRADEDRLCAALRNRLQGHRRYHLPDYRADARMGDR
ncbi:MAG TPA: hypothetical protein VK929_07355 [Longimicrobiales bacterium]|nr:hypothetical protein [Longimicrobiales bacterium]